MKIIVNYDPHNNDWAIADGNCYQFAKDAVKQFNENKTEMILYSANWLTLQGFSACIAKGLIGNKEVEFHHNEDILILNKTGGFDYDKNQDKLIIPDWWSADFFEDVLWDLI